MSIQSWFSLDETSVDQTEFTRLWVVATATYGVGDMVTTIALLKFSEAVAEGNVVVRVLTDAFGQSGLITLKLAVFLACIATSVDAAKRDDPLLYYLPPAVLAIVGAFTTAWNIRLMLG